MNEICDSICGRSSAQHTNYSDIWDLTEWWEVTDNVKTLLRITARDNWTNEQTSEFLTDMPENYKKMVIDVITLRGPEIKQSLISSSCAISDSHLKDFDWKLKMTLSSDKLSNIKQPLATLDLHLQKNKKREVHSTEMSRQELDKLITSLEGANKAVQQMRCRSDVT